MEAATLVNKVSLPSQLVAAQESILLHYVQMDSLQIVGVVGCGSGDPDLLPRPSSKDLKLHLLVVASFHGV